MSAAPKKKSNALTIILVLAALGAVGICVVGVLAAIAIPAFTGYLARSKTSEATHQLGSIASAAQSYYEQEHPSPSGVLTHCVVDSARSSNEPSSLKSIVSDWPASFVALGVTPPDPLYYQYEIVSVGGCGHDSSVPSLYSFRAHGDLDGDGTRSLFELAAGDQGGRLVRSAQVYIENELE